jgi:hypothetical protein
MVVDLGPTQLEITDNLTAICYESINPKKIFTLQLDEESASLIVSAFNLALKKFQEKNKMNISIQEAIKLMREGKVLTTNGFYFKIEIDQDGVEHLFKCKSSKFDNLYWADFKILDVESLEWRIVHNESEKEKLIKIRDKLTEVIEEINNDS